MRTNEQGSATAVLATILGLIVLVAVVVGGYLGGWWLQTDVANRQANLNRHGFEQQTTFRDEMIRKITDVKSIDVQIAQANGDAGQQQALRAQRQAIVDIVCRDNTHISGSLDDSTASFVTQECK